MEEEKVASSGPIDNAEWVRDLEVALTNECSSASTSEHNFDDEISNYCEITRPEIWKENLQIKNGESVIDNFDEIFDLPGQQLLREDCQRFVSTLGNLDEDKISVLSDVESIITCYCKSDAKFNNYETNNGWIELLFPLITLKLPRSCIYNMFEKIRTTYVPRNVDSFHLLRLLILYHDPQLCNFLDTKKITPEQFCKPWFQTLFAASCNLQVVLSVWDFYFQKGDVFLVFFLSLVIVVNAREAILQLNDEPKTKIIEMISLLPANLTLDDVEDFCALAQYYDCKTPSSFKNDLENVLFNEYSNNGKSLLSQALCLPVSVSEVISNSELRNYTNDDQKEDVVRFFLIDCRPADQYNAGHAPTAFHLDCNLMLQEPNSFSMAVQGLLSFQRQAVAAGSKAGGEHLVFLGCGELLEDQYTHMVVASFLQKHIQFVSLVTGGYEALHLYLSDKVDSYLQDHNVTQCLICKRDRKSFSNNADVYGSNNNTNGNVTPSSPSNDLFGKISSVMKSKSAEVKEKLYEYISNTNQSNGTADRHISSNDKLDKRYRNVAPIFSIDDDHEITTNSASEDNNVGRNQEELVRLSSWMKEPDIIISIKCQEVKMNGYMFDCHLTVTKTHLVVLRETDKKDVARITVNRPLNSIVRITSRKKYPELITFQYGTITDVTDMDRFLIPNSAVITRIISDQINGQKQ